MSPRLVWGYVLCEQTANLLRICSCDKLCYCCVPIFIATGVCRVLCMHWVSRVTMSCHGHDRFRRCSAVGLPSVCSGVLSGVSPRLDTRTFCHRLQPPLAILSLVFLTLVYSFFLTFVLFIHSYLTRCSLPIRDTCQSQLIRLQTLRPAASQPHVAAVY